MNRLLLSLGVALGVGLVAAPAQAQWKWRDKSGIVQYSDVPPPPSIADKDILERPAAPVRRAAAASAPPPAAAASVAPASGDAELENRRKSIEQKAQEEAAAQKKVEGDKVAAQRAESCQRAQAQMRTLDSGIRLSRVNEKGEREILDDKDRSVEMQRARNIIAADCAKQQ